MYFFQSNKIQSIHLKNKEIGGVRIEGEAELKVLISGKHLQLVLLNLKSGYFHPKHKHPDNESTGYLISGLIKMMVGNQEFILQPGDSWHHPMGVYHWTKALKDSQAVEIHSPPRIEFK